jgi:NAD(P)-dependent dehydrogenase (short-subunit alcohol dehydrogenase family)
VHHNSNEEARVFSLPPVDLSTLEGGVRLASEVDELCTKEDLQLSVIMNNAGVYAEDHVVTEEGLELTFAVNVLAPFVITSLLLPRLLKQKRTNTVYIRRSRSIILHRCLLVVVSETIATTPLHRLCVLCATQRNHK